VRQVVVLVEGRSDAAAVRPLLRRHDLGAARVVDMGGVTNFARHLRDHHDQAVVGLCDVGEEYFLVHAFELRGDPVDGRSGLAERGFFVCVRDLEDELIRALGTDQVLDALADLGELARFRTFQHQPEWRGRPLPDQLRRFAGAGSGRKERLAAELAQRLDPAHTSEPLAGLVRAVAARLS